MSNTHTILLRRAVEFEEKSQFQAALQDYLTAIQSISDLLLTSPEMPRRQYIELRNNMEISISRAKFLCASVELDASARHDCSLKSSVIQLDSASIFNGSCGVVNNSTLKRCISRLFWLTSVSCENKTVIPTTTMEVPTTIASKSRTYKVKKWKNISAKSFDFDVEEGQSTLCQATNASNKLTLDDVYIKQNRIKTQLLRSVLIENPNVSKQSIIGLDKAKGPIREAIPVPILYPDTVQARNSWKGILLFGPSGVGKTQLIKAVATEAQHTTFINLRVDTILSKWMGDSEKTIRALFEIARERSPSIIFIDEVDALCGARGAEDSEASRRLKNTLLTEMDGIVSNGSTSSPSKVLVVGNTNQPHLLDNAFLRRFAKRIYVPLPSFRERKEILQHSLKDYKSEVLDEDLEKICAQTQRYSGADLVTLVTTAGMIPLQEQLKNKGLDYRLSTSTVPRSVRKINQGDFRIALRSTNATNDESLVRKLQSWNDKFGDTPSPVDFHENDEISKCSSCFAGCLGFFF